MSSNLPTIDETEDILIKSSEPVDNKKIKMRRIKCKILPTMDNVVINIDENGTLKDFDDAFTRETQLYAQSIIFRGEILKNYTISIKSLKLRNVDEFFILKREMSHTTIRSSSSSRTATNLLRQFLSSNYGIRNDGDSEEIQYRFELTDGENTYPISDDETTNTFTSALNQLFDSTFSSTITSSLIPPAPSNSDDEGEDEEDIPPPPPLIPIPPPSRYRYQTEFEQIRNMGYIDEVAIRQALNITSGDISSALIYL